MKSLGVPNARKHEVLDVFFNWRKMIELSLSKNKVTWIGQWCRVEIGSIHEVVLRRR